MEDEVYVAQTTQQQQQQQQQQQDDDDDDIDDHRHQQFASYPSLSEPLLRQPASAPPILHRCKTVPNLAVLDDVGDVNATRPQPPEFVSWGGGWVVKQALVLLLIYLSSGVAIYSFNTEEFSGVETHPLVDALYFCIVTMCTIGYGDIAPTTPFTKLFACVFVLVGFGFIDILLSGVVNYVLDLQENMILGATHTRQNHKQSVLDCIVDPAKGRMRIRLKVGMALAVVLLCVGAGTLFLHLAEDLDWMDSLYLAIMSVTTVGYGDRAFNTIGGRVFASVWLLVSTLAVAKAFLYLAEARVDRRHRRIANWVLQRDFTVHDLVAASINDDDNNNHHRHRYGVITKSEYIIYKLKEMGKINEKDISQICNQFAKLVDPNKSAKITLPHLLHHHYRSSSSTSSSSHTL